MVIRENLPCSINPVIPRATAGLLTFTSYGVIKEIRAPN